MNTTQATQTPLQMAIVAHEAKHLTKFKPTRTFYEQMGINRIRFWQIVEGTKNPEINEARALAKFFNVPLNDLF
jgi:DNA-binding XRE family transcriptional regulator